MSVALPGPGSEHGVYVYEGGVWRLLRREGEGFSLGELGNGVYVIYFDNTLCPACREQDLQMVEVVKRFGGDSRVRLVVVLCDWFTQICDSEAASKTFEEFRVSASPTIVVATVKNGRTVFREDLRGVKPAGVIAMYLERALDAFQNPES